MSVKRYKNPYQQRAMEYYIPLEDIDKDLFRYAEIIMYNTPSKYMSVDAPRKNVTIEMFKDIIDNKLTKEAIQEKYKDKIAGIYRELLSRRNKINPTFKESFNEIKPTELKKYNDNEKQPITIYNEIKDEMNKTQQKKIKAESTMKLNERLAYMKNKYEEQQEQKYKDEIGQLREQQDKIQEEITASIQSLSDIPKYQELIKKLSADEAWKLSPSELQDLLIKRHGIKDKKTAETLQQAIYNKAIDSVYNKYKMKKLIKIQGYNPQAFEHLPESVKDKMQQYITENYNEEQERKNLKYLLPSVKPEWTRENTEYKINPLIFRKPY